MDLVGKQLASVVKTADFPLDLAPLNRQTTGPKLIGFDSERLSPRIGEYVLRELLSENRYGIVYRGMHIRLKKEVSIRCITETWTRDSCAAFQLENQIRLIGNLEHPSIATIMDAGESEGNRYLVTQWIRGVDLKRVVKLLGPLAVVDACEIVCKVATAMSFAHERGLTHGDLRPRKLLLDFDASPAPNPKITGLGFSRAFLKSLHFNQNNDANGVTASNLNETGSSAIPSQLNPSWDVRSLGATLWYVMTKQRVASRLIEKNQNSDRVDTLTLEAEGIPPSLVTIVRQMLSCNVDEQVFSMQETANALASYATGHQLTLIANRAEQRLNQSRLDLDLDESRSTTSAFGETLAPIPLKQPSLSESQTVQTPGPNLRTPQKPRGSGRILLWLGLTSMAGILFGASFLWFVTDGGYVSIRAESSVDATFDLLRQGKRIEAVHVTSAQTIVPKWYRSGQYELKLPKGLENSFYIEGKRFSLGRNQTHSIVIRPITHSVSE